jgi:Zn-dependent M16 (insulinase) family peptidase
MKKLLSIVLILMMLSMSFVTAETKPLKVAMILTGVANDAGWNQIAYEGLCLLRDQYGVYSPCCSVYISDDGGMYIYTYRDPNIAETFRVLDGLPEMIAGSGIDRETLDGYILEAYTYYAMPQGELSGAVNAAEAVLKGRPQDEAVTSMRQLKQLTLEKLADYTGLLEKFSEVGAVRTAGGAAAIKAEADRYDKILRPFGTADGK